jgi:hypothetical protein
MNLHANQNFAFRKVLGAALLAALVALGVSVTPGAASAGEGTVEAPFNLVGFDAGVARAHGYEVVTLPGGSVASVPAKHAAAARGGTYKPTTGVLEPAGKQPDSGPTANAYQEKVGECGRSYVSLNSTGSRKANLGTGFFLDNTSAGNPWDVHWTVHITDNGGVSNQGYSEGDGRIAGNAWLGRNRVLTLTRGYALAKVTAGSWTLTTRGWICYSYGPEVEEFIN